MAITSRMKTSTPLPHISFMATSRAVEAYVCAIATHTHKPGHVCAACAASIELLNFGPLSGNWSNGLHKLSTSTMALAIPVFNAYEREREDRVARNTEVLERLGLPTARRLALFPVAGITVNIPMPKHKRPDPATAACPCSYLPSLNTLKQVLTSECGPVCCESQGAGCQLLVTQVYSLLSRKNRSYPSPSRSSSTSPLLQRAATHTAYGRRAPPPVWWCTAWHRGKVVSLLLSNDMWTYADVN